MSELPPAPSGGRVAISGLVLDPRQSGARRRFVQLYQTLMRLGEYEDLIFYLPKEAAAEADALFPGTPMVITPLSFEKPLERARRAPAIWKEQLEKSHARVLHLDAPPVVKIEGVKLVYTLHDARHFRPGISRRKIYARLVLRRQLGHVDRLVTVTEAMANEIHRRTGYPREQIVVIPNAVGPEFSPVRDTERQKEVRERYGLPEQFILSVGHLEPRKNLFSAIHAMSFLKCRGAKLPALVFAGRNVGRHHKHLALRAARLGVELHLPGYVDDDDLPALYSAAQVLAFPSSYEGFGIPLLEAMACGLPVVAADHPVIREVVGDAAALVDPNDHEAFAKALWSVTLDQRRAEELRQAGFERARRFHWFEPASRLRALYDELKG
ncbi:MAG: glycosyltransferase family 1 protein [Planctomycetota bacterium]